MTVASVVSGSSIMLPPPPLAPALCADGREVHPYRGMLHLKYPLSPYSLSLCHSKPLSFHLDVSLTRARMRAANGAMSDQEFLQNILRCPAVALGLAAALAPLPRVGAAAARALPLR